MDLKGKSLFVLAIFVFLIGAVSAEELNDTVAIDNGDLSQSDALETISVDDDVEKYANTQNISNAGKEFGVVETNDVDNESYEVSSVATTTVTVKTFQGIRDVIASASAGDTIRLTGTYTGNGTTIVINKNLNFVGVNGATLDAKSLSRIISITSSVKVTFTDITFKNGKTTGGSNMHGAAAYITSGSVNFTNCDFISNTAQNLGGAVYITSSGSMNFVNCNFKTNTAKGTASSANHGGAVYIAGTGPVNFTNCKFTSNTAQSVGGAVSIRGIGSVDFIDCDFTSNTVTKESGGAVYIYSGSVNFTNCDFTDNTANTAGGAIIIANSGSANFTSCNFISNTATTNGGAVNSGSSSSSSFINCNFTGNTATTNGGAVYLGSTSGSFINCYFTGNTATTNGEAVYLAGSASGSFINCDFTDNVNDKTKSVIYLGSTNSRLWLSGNSIVTGSIPIYIDSGVVVSSTCLVVLNNQTVESQINTQIALTACLYDDNGNLIGSSTGITLKVVGLTSGLTASFNSDNLNYSVDYTPKVGGVYPVTGIVPSTVANNVTKYMNGTLIIPITTLDVDLIVNNTNPALDDIIQYTITIKNTGAFNANVSVEDILDSSKLEYISCSPFGVYNHNTGLWSIENLDVNQETSLNITVRVKYIGEINNSVTVKSQQVLDDITKNVTIVVSKKVLNITDMVVDLLNATMNNVTVKVTLPIDVTGDITIDINGSVQTKTIVDGVVVMEFSNIKPGTYNMNVTYGGNNEYEPLTVFKEFTINKNDLNRSDIQTEILNNTYGNATVRVTVPSDATGNITIQVNGQNYTGKIENGVAIIELFDVTPGNYTANVIYSGDDNYNPISTEMDLEIIKRNINTSNIKTEILNNTYGNTCVNVTVPKNVTGNITINVNDKEYNGTIENGSVIIELFDVPVGNYTMNITYSGDDNHNPISTEADLEVVKANISHLETIVVNNTYGNVTIKVNVPNNATGDITINVNGENYTETINNGEVTIKIPDIPVGDYKMNVTYKGDNNYNPLTTEEDLKVRLNLKPEQVTVNILNNTYGNTTVQVTVPYNVTGNVTIKVGNKNYTANITGGVAVIKMFDLPVGNYSMNMDIIYNGDDNYNPLTKHEDLEVIKANSSLDAETLNSTYSNTTIKVTVPKDATGNVTIKINDKLYNGTISNGFAIVKLDNVTVGNYTMTISYPGDNNYNPSSLEKELEVVKCTIATDNMVVDIINNTYGNTTVKVTVPNDASGNVTITVGGKNYTGNISNGSAIIKLPDVPVGNHTMTITYPGDDNYNPISKDENLEIVKGNLNSSDVKAEILNNTYGNTTVKITVPENATGNITIKVGNQTYNGTIENGSVIIKLPDVPAGNHTMNITYSGDDNYNPISTEEELEIVKSNLNSSDMIVDVLNNTYGNTTVKVTLPNDATGIVTIKVNGNEYKGNISNGSAIIKLPDVPAGNYTMDVTYNGDNNYNPIAKEEQLEVVKSKLNPGDVKVEIINDTAGNVTIKVTVPGNETGNVTIKIGDKIYNGTVENGSAIIKIPDINSGNYTANVTFEGDNYDPISQDIQLEITKAKINLPIEAIDITYGETEKVTVWLPEDATGYIVFDVNGTCLLESVKCYSAKVI